jgi:hypothetical protein
MSTSLPAAWYVQAHASQGALSDLLVVVRPAELMGCALRPSIIQRVREGVALLIDRAQPLGREGSSR